MNCHAIQGEGGKKGPDLFGITQRHSEDWLKKMIGNPRTVNPASTMSELNPKLKNRNQIIQNIIAYLKTKK